MFSVFCAFFYYYGGSADIVFQQVRFLGDPSGEFTKALDLSFDSSAIFGNDRSKRYVLLVEDGKVKEAFVEPDNTGLNGTSFFYRAHRSMLTSLESFRCREGARLKSSLYRAVISLQIVEENISCPEAQHLFLVPAARYFVAQGFNVQIFHPFQPGQRLINRCQN